MKTAKEAFILVCFFGLLIFILILINNPEKISPSLSKDKKDSINLIKARKKMFESIDEYKNALKMEEKL